MMFCTASTGFAQAGALLDERDLLIRHAINEITKDYNFRTKEFNNQQCAIVVLDSLNRLKERTQFDGYQVCFLNLEEVFLYDIVRYIRVDEIKLMRNKISGRFAVIDLDNKTRHRTLDSYRFKLDRKSVNKP
jgi:hypothetical protein